MVGGDTRDGVGGGEGTDGVSSSAEEMTLHPNPSLIPWRRPAFTSHVEIGASRRSIQFDDDQTWMPTTKVNKVPKITKVNKVC